MARTPDQWLVMGLIYPATNQVDAAALADLSARLAQNQAFLSGWELLGSTTLKRVQARLWQVVAPMVVLVLASLWFAFRRPTEILLGLAVLLLSGLCLLATMAVAGWSWNLLNLMALPLMLGTGVDYSIFMQLALRRHGGDLRPGSALHRAGAVAVRRHGHGRVWLVGLVQQSGHGQPGQGVRGWHWSQYADSPCSCSRRGGLRCRSNIRGRRQGRVPATRDEPTTAQPARSTLPRAPLPFTAPACGGSDWPSCESCRLGW